MFYGRAKNLLLFFPWESAYREKGVIYLLVLKSYFSPGGRYLIAHTGEVSFAKLGLKGLPQRNAENKDRDWGNLNFKRLSGKGIKIKIEKSPCGTSSLGNLGLLLPNYFADLFQRGKWGKEHYVLILGSRREEYTWGYNYNKQTKNG